MNRKNKGWFDEPTRHGLAAYGINTSVNEQPKQKVELLEKDNDGRFILPEPIKLETSDGEILHANKAEHIFDGMEFSDFDEDTKWYSITLQGSMEQITKLREVLEDEQIEQIIRGV